MNLEAVERRVLQLLGSTSNPLVPLSRVEQHLQADEATRGLARNELLDFLRGHELFYVLEWAQEPAWGGLSAFESAGFEVGPFIVLETRRPSSRQLHEQMLRQMDRIISALTAALREAREEGSELRVRQVQAVLDKATELSNRLGNLPE